MFRNDERGTVRAMGAFDTYEAVGRCPTCRAYHYVRGQTKAFDPDFGGFHSRHFSPGKSQPLEFAPSQMLESSVWEGEWWRVRPQTSSRHLALLVDYDELFGCSCGQPLVAILQFEADEEARSITLHGVELHDARLAEYARHVDLASGERVLHWNGDHTSFMSSLSALAESRFELRARRLREVVENRFEGHERWLAPSDKELSGWTVLIGQVQCECCGVSRERRVQLSITHPAYTESILGTGWDGGVLRLGQRLRCNLDWMERDEDRGWFLRVHHPLARDHIRVCGAPESWGCPCGAGRGSVVVQFSVDDHGLLLQSIHLRVMQSLEDLHDIALAYAPWSSRGQLREEWGTRWQPSNRTEALALLQSRWRLS